MRRLAILCGVFGAIAGAVLCYSPLKDLLESRAEAKRFEELRNSKLIQRVLASASDLSDGKTEIAIDQEGIRTIEVRVTRRGQTGRKAEGKIRGEAEKPAAMDFEPSPDMVELRSIELTDGQILLDYPGPSLWYVALFLSATVLCFLVPWVLLRSIGWVLVGFFPPKSKT